jgi:cobalt-zinc-cadmium efflux system outer membrane protein
MNHLRTLFTCVALSSLAMAQGPANGLTLQQVLQRLRTQSPNLAASRAHLDAIRANEVTAALRPNPVLSSANQDFNVFNPSQFDIANGQEFTESLIWLVERGHKRQARVASAQSGTVVAEDLFRDSQRQLEFAAKAAFVTMLAAKANLKLAQDNLADYQRTLEANQLRLKAGDISETEFDRSKLEEARFRTDLLSAELSLKQSRVQLEALLGMNESADFDISGTLEAPELRFTFEELRDSALANRPDYLAAKGSVRKADADFKLATANGATDFTIAPEYKRNGPENTIGFTVQVPLRIFDRNQGEKLRTNREIESSRFAETAAHIQTVADVQQAWDGYQTARERANIYRAEYLNRARVVRDRLAFSYQHGATSLLDYLDTMRTYRDVQLAATTADALLWNSIHQLSFVTGTELVP